MTGKNQARICGVVVATLLGAASFAAAGAAPGDVIDIADAGLTQPVGMAADATRGVYWLTDSAAQPGKVHAVDAGGVKVGSVSYPAVPQSPQALAFYQGLLYVADIGDDELARPNVQVHVLDGLAYEGAAGLTTWRLIYPDGPHDAKALTISPRGNIYLVTFGAPGAIYRAVAPAPGVQNVELSYVAPAPDWVTDAVFVDPGRIAVRGYDAIQILDAANDSFVPLSSVKLTPAQAGEALTLSQDGTGLVVSGPSLGGNQQSGAQQNGARLSELAVPSGLAELPKAASTPPKLSTPTPTPTPSASASPSRREQLADRGVNSNTTRIATVVALAFAVLMGALAYRERR